MIEQFIFFVKKRNMLRKLSYARLNCQLILVFSEEKNGVGKTELILSHYRTPATQFSTSIFFLKEKLSHAQLVFLQRKTKLVYPMKLGS